MGKNAFGERMRRGTPSALSCQSDDKGSRGGQGDASGDSKSAGEQETLEAKKEKDVAKEAFDGRFSRKIGGVEHELHLRELRRLPMTMLITLA